MQRLDDFLHHTGVKTQTMQSRLATLFTIVRGRAVEARWHINRFIFKRLPIKTVLEVRNGTISQRRLENIVRIGLNAGFHVEVPKRFSYVSLQRTFNQICEHLVISEQDRARRRACRYAKYQANEA